MKSLLRGGQAEQLASPPSRGAWIEICGFPSVFCPYGSPPSRGAWIEMFLASVAVMVRVVAPLAGGVD